MDSILSSITQGRPQRQGLRVVIAGQEKIGKTTLSSMAPGALIVPLEVGTADIAAPKTRMVQSLDDTKQLIAEIVHWAQRGQFPYQSLVFDSATALERHIHDAVVRRDPAFKPGNKNITIETCLGGYGRGIAMANDEFDGLLNQLDQLAAYGGINVIFTCHVFSSKIMDPTAGEYDSWDLLLHSPKNQKNYGKRERITQWADIIGFMYEPIFVSQEKTLSKAMTQAKGRVLGLSRTPSYVAGNRFGIQGEFQIPAPPANGWNVLASTLYQSKGIDVYNRQ